MAEKQQTVGANAYGCCALVWLVVFYLFGFTAMDPAACWVTEGELWVSQTPTGGANEFDVAALWRSWFVYAFIVYIALCVFPCLTGGLFLAGEKMAIPAGICGILAMLAKCAQCGLWFWALFGMRFFNGFGPVAAGKMIMECEQANPNLTNANNAAASIDGAAGDAASQVVTALTGGASCNDPMAFQTKSGKLFFAWLIVSFCCG